MTTMTRTKEEKRRAELYGSARAVPALRKAIGAQVRFLRQQAEMSQSALGEKAGLSGKFIGEIERGDKSVSVDSLYRVGKALGITWRSPLGDETNGA